MRQKGSFWSWYKMMGIIKALKCCQNLYQVVVCPCPGAFFQMMTFSWPWPFLWPGQICFLMLLYGWQLIQDWVLMLIQIECSCISKFVLIQRIFSTQVSDIMSYFDIINFQFLDGDVPWQTSYGVYISQLIRFARASAHVSDFNCHNKALNR